MTDKGFKPTSRFYPNLNKILSPTFMNRREQFMPTEIRGDRKKCKARYFSETNNSRLTDCTYLRDTINWNKFVHLHHVVEWAHGVANLNDPFYIPIHGEYFDNLKMIRKEEREKRKAILTRQQLKRKAAYERTLSAAARRNQDFSASKNSTTSDEQHEDSWLVVRGEINVNPRIHDNVPELTETYTTVDELIDSPTRESEIDDGEEKN